MLPPLVGLAVKLTEVPAHTLFNEEAMLTDGVTFGLTVMRIELETTLVGTAQLALLVSVNRMVSPLESDAVLKLEAFVPTIAPFLDH